ncbi:ATP-binding protein [Myxococcus xanthus]|nr:ATP-binding protein [Myxococcus xanthus]
MAGKHNVLLTGLTGVGKSILAPALRMRSLRGRLAASTHSSCRT